MRGVRIVSHLIHEKTVDRVEGVIAVDVSFYVNQRPRGIRTVNVSEHAPASISQRIHRAGVVGIDRRGRAVIRIHDSHERHSIRGLIQCTPVAA